MKGQSIFRTLSRVGVGAMGMLMLYLALAFYLRLSVVDDFWPWGSSYDEMSPLTYYFLSSIAAAICAPLFWIAATGNLRASTSGGMNLAVVFGSIGVYMYQSHTANPENPRLLPGAIILGVSALANAAIFFLARKVPPQDPTQLPKVVRASFVVFCIALVLVGTALVRVRPNIVPWEVTPEASIVYGCIFLGAATYFAYAILNPLWENAAGPLLGFLAYDIVLILPFINRFADVPEEQRWSLIIYTAVVSYSGLLAIFYLFINPATRLSRRAKVSLGKKGQL